MVALRRQLSWLLKGSDHMQTVHADHDRAIQELSSQLAELRAQLDAMPRELRAAVDDLGDRIGALNARYDADHPSEPRHG